MKLVLTWNVEEKKADEVTVNSTYCFATCKKQVNAQ